MINGFLSCTIGPPGIQYPTSRKHVATCTHAASRVCVERLARIIWSCSREPGTTADPTKPRTPQPGTGTRRLSSAEAKVPRDAPTKVGSRTTLGRAKSHSGNPRHEASIRTSGASSHGLLSSGPARRSRSILAPMNCLEIDRTAGTNLTESRHAVHRTRLGDRNSGHNAFKYFDHDHLPGKTIINTKETWR